MENVNTFLSKLSDIKISNPDDNFVIVGDWNFPKIKWINSSEIGAIPVQYTDSLSCHFIDTLSLLLFDQYNTQYNKLDRILDLVLSNLECTVESSQNPIVPIDEHHPALLISISVSVKSLNSNARIIKLFGQADYSLINEALSKVDWALEINSCEMELATKRFYKSTYHRRLFRIVNFPLGMMHH